MKKSTKPLLRHNLRRSAPLNKGNRRDFVEAFQKLQRSMRQSDSGSTRPPDKLDEVRAQYRIYAGGVVLKVHDGR